ncbi:hypothetical protein D3C72_2017020 [compost metagenome]
MATIELPINVLPPGRLSTTTDCFQRVVSFSPTVRASVSLNPPGVYGTTMRIGLSG